MAALRQPDGDILASLGEYAHRLHDLGMTGEEDRVLTAMSQVHENPQAAASLLHEIADALMALAPAYSHRSS